MSKKRTPTKDVVPSAPITPADINKANREFWGQEKEIEQRNPLRYFKARIALEAAKQKDISRALEQIRKHDLDPHDLAAVTITLVSAASDDQSKKAQKPRPKKKQTHRSIAIAAMKAWRKNNPTGTFADFIDGAGEGSVDGLTIVALNLPGVERHEVDSDDLPDGKPVAQRTLEDWWKESKQ